MNSAIATLDTEITELEKLCEIWKVVDRRDRKGDLYLFYCVQLKEHRIAKTVLETRMKIKAK